MKALRNKKGDAMIYVVCIMGIIVALCLSLVASASVVYASARDRIEAEKCRILTVSVSEQLERYMTGQEYLFETQAEEDAKRVTNGGELWFYLRDHVWKDWTYYNADERGHFADLAHRTFSFSTTPQYEEKFGAIEDIKVVIYWESDYESYISGREENGIGVRNGTSLTINVTCVLSGEACTISSIYELGCETLTTDGVSYEQWLWSLTERS